MERPARRSGHIGPPDRQAILTVSFQAPSRAVPADDPFMAPLLGLISEARSVRRYAAGNIFSSSSVISVDDHASEQRDEERVHPVR
jgi:hypothetical protein